MTIHVDSREPVRLYSPGVARAMLRHESQSRSFADRLRALHRKSEIEKRQAGLEIGIPLGINTQQYLSGVVTPANFASLVPGAYLVLQSDLGLTYGPTTFAAGATPPDGTLSGTLPTRSVPILFKCTTPGVIGGGAKFAGYVDGVGTTPIMTGISPLAGAPVALGGACTGLSHAWAAGTAAIDNTWRATCSAWADQSGRGKHATEASPVAQPIVTPGLNGKPGLLFDGINDQLTSTVQSLLTSLPYQAIVVARCLNTGVATSILGTNNFVGPSFYFNFANVLRAYNGNAGFDIAFASTSPARFSETFTGSVADVLRAGAGSLTGFNAGNAIPSVLATVTSIGCFPVFAFFGNIEVFAVVITPPVDLAAFDAAINSAAGYGPGSIAV